MKTWKITLMSCSGDVRCCAADERAGLAAEAVERVETEAESVDVASQVLVEPAVEQRVDARRRHRETLQRQVGQLEVPAADDVVVQLGD